MRFGRLTGSTLVALGLLALTACGNETSTGMQDMSGQQSMQSPATSSSLLDPAAFADAMAQSGRVTIDVHIPFEGKLNSTDLMIPYDQIEQQKSALPADRSTPLAVYCRSGNMSAIAVQTLAGLGFTDIVELRGGMQAWQAAGRTLLMTP